MEIDPDLSPEVMDYYEKVSKGLVERRPYEYWGPETEDEKAHWDRWLLPIEGTFYPVDWSSRFTGRGSKAFVPLTVHVLRNADDGVVAMFNEMAFERPGFIGPMGEMLLTDVDPVSERIVYRIASRTSFRSKVAKRMKEKRRRSLEAVTKIYKRVKEQFVPFGDLCRMTRCLTTPWSSTATMHSTEGRKPVIEIIYEM